MRLERNDKGACGLHKSRENTVGANRLGVVGAVDAKRTKPASSEVVSGGSATRYRLHILNLRS